MTGSRQEDELEITLSGPKRPNRERVRRPGRSAIIRASSRWGEDGPKFYFAFGAFADIRNHVDGVLDREVGGFLLGHSGSDAEGRFIDVTAAIPAQAAEEGRASLTFTHETWNRMAEEKNRVAPGSKVVGWYHSHPGYGVFFSPDDVFIQRNFFAGPEMVGLVVDPHIRAEAADEEGLGLYQWLEAGLVKREGWCVYRDGRGFAEVGRQWVGWLHDLWK